MGLVSSLRRSLARSVLDNLYNEGFFKFIGGGVTTYDTNSENYVEHGFKKNSAVYSIVRQRFEKVRSIPYYIGEIQSGSAAMKADRLLKASRGDLSPAQLSRYKTLFTKAYRADAREMPLKRPNPIQTWGELFAMYEMYMAIDGNCYFYIHRSNVLSRKPQRIYILPPQKMTIVVKDKYKLEEDFGMDGTPIDHYMIKDGPQYIEFKPEEIVHIKLPNPDFSDTGAHLYGQSPLRSVFRNIDSFNSAVDNNVRMMKNAGIYGIIHGKGHRSLTKTQADQVKERLEEMDADTNRLGSIAGVSAEIGFTRIGLTPGEMKAFEYANFDEKQIANALGWDARLLNQDSGATFDNLKIAEKRVVVATTKPSIDMFCEAFNERILPMFEGYENSRLIFDFSELPEMQVDQNKLVEWLSASLDRGSINRNEYRVAIGYDPIDDEYMNKYTVSQFLEPLDAAIDDGMALSNNPNEPNPLPE